jgi:hypothetical protein
MWKRGVLVLVVALAFAGMRVPNALIGITQPVVALLLAFVVFVGLAGASVQDVSQN